MMQACNFEIAKKEEMAREKKTLYSVLQFSMALGYLQKKRKSADPLKSCMPA